MNPIGALRGVGVQCISVMPLVGQDKQVLAYKHYMGYPRSMRDSVEMPLL